MVATIRRTLKKNLDVYMGSVKGDIEKFNLHVWVQHDALLSPGETSSADLLTNLFTAYDAVEDKVFHDYMVGQQDQYNDRCIDFDVDSLMDLALNKYKMLIESSKWNLPAAWDTTKVDAQIIALTAKLEYFKKNNKDAAAEKKEKSRKAKVAKKWAWKLVPPAEGDAKSKIFDGKSYHWCINHASWTVHTLAECNIKDEVRPVPKDQQCNKVKKALALSAAYNTIMEDDDEGSNNARDEDNGGDSME